MFVASCGLQLLSLRSNGSMRATNEEENGTNVVHTSLTPDPGLSMTPTDIEQSQVEIYDGLTGAGYQDPSFRGPCNCPCHLSAILHSPPSLEDLGGELLLRYSSLAISSRASCWCSSQDHTQHTPASLQIVWTLPSWLRFMHFRASASLMTTTVAINATIIAPNTVPWSSPLLKAARAKDMATVRRLLSCGGGSIHDVDEAGANAMSMMLFRQGNTLDCKNMSTLIDNLKSWIRAGCRTDRGPFTGISITDVLMMLILVDRAKTGLWNDGARPEAIDALCNACQLDPWETWMSLKTSIRQVPLLAALLRIDKSLPPFDSLVMNFARSGTLKQMSEMALWKEQVFSYNVTFTTVANTWHGPLQLLLRHVVSVHTLNGHYDVRRQTLLHQLAGCAYWRAPPEEDFLATEKVLLEAGVEANSRDSEGETFLHNLILLPYSMRPLEMLHQICGDSVDWRAVNNAGDTAFDKYQKFWQIEATLEGRDSVRGTSAPFDEHSSH